MTTAPAPAARRVLDQRPATIVLLCPGCKHGVSKHTRDGCVAPAPGGGTCKCGLTPLMIRGLQVRA